MEIFYERLIIYGALFFYIFYRMLNDFFTVRVPTPSMYPQIHCQDRILIRRLRGKEGLSKGNIYVFRYEGESGNEDRLMIKRLCGLPFERIEIRGGLIFENGIIRDEPYVLNRSDENMIFDIPEGKYLFLGDNRAASYDARFWKDRYIEKKNIAGIALFRFYPLNRMGFVK